MKGAHGQFCEVSQLLAGDARGGQLADDLLNACFDHVLPEDGGEPESFVESPAGGKLGLMFPFVMPGAETLLCSTRGGAGLSGALVAVDMKTKEIKDLAMAGTNPRWIPTGPI